MKAISIVAISLFSGFLSNAHQLILVGISHDAASKITCEQYFQLGISPKLTTIHDTTWVDFGNLENVYPELQLKRNDMDYMADLQGGDLLINLYNKKLYGKGANNTFLLNEFYIKAKVFPVKNSSATMLYSYSLQPKEYLADRKKLMARKLEILEQYSKEGQLDKSTLQLWETASVTNSIQNLCYYYNSVTKHRPDTKVKNPDLLALGTFTDSLIKTVQPQSQFLPDYNRFLYDAGEYLYARQVLASGEVVGSNYWGNQKALAEPFAIGQMKEVHEIYELHTIINSEGIADCYNSQKEKLLKAYPQNPLFDLVAEMKQKYQSLSIGGNAPNIFGRNEEGEITNLYQLVKGKKGAVIMFWASWCSGCVRTKKIVNELAPKYGKEILFLNISTDGDKKAWKKAIEKSKLQGTQMLCTEAEGNLPFKLYAVDAIPRLIALDKNYKVVAVNEGGLEKVVEALISK